MNSWTARNYNRYFDGFSERDVVTAKGKVKTERIYTGEYFREKASEEQWKRRKALVGVGYCASILIFLVSGTIDCSANSTWYVILFSGITLAVMILATMNVYTKVTAPRDMIARVFRSAAEQYRKRIRLMAVCMLLTGFGVFVNLLIHLFSVQMNSLLCFMGYTVSGLIMYRLYTFEDNNMYQKIENKVRLAEPNDYIQITY